MGVHPTFKITWNSFQLRRAGATSHLEKPLPMYSRKMAAGPYTVKRYCLSPSLIVMSGNEVPVKKLQVLTSTRRQVLCRLVAIAILRKAVLPKDTWPF